MPTYQDAGEMVLRVDLPPNMSDREQMELYKECGFNKFQKLWKFYLENEPLKDIRNMSYGVNVAP